jgi:ABC-type sugar transport system ATPase subunit
VARSGSTAGPCPPAGPPRPCAWGSRFSRAIARPRLELQAPSLGAPVSTLSGGNQQKALLARLWLTEPAVLLLDEPTRGVDVAAKARIHRLIDEWSRAGRAVALTSSELPELLALSDRVLVLHRGEVHADLGRLEASAEKVIAAALGGAA